MFKKILIANRGEIACRIARTCRRLGIACATVHSDADQDALHVRQIGQSVFIGPAPASASYLNIEVIIEAARQVGADAIHPGYGFLSESPDLARAATAADIVFIGPSADVLTKFGDKAAAKWAATAAGVPVVPGSDEASSEPAVILSQIEDMQMPVLLKAAGGGGGKGMRVIEDLPAAKTEIEAAMREATSSFGDPRLLVEQFLPEARHIEVQILGDGKGEVIHLLERECSLQRRHQKVVEEAPAIDLDPVLRQEILSSAVKLCQSVDYLGLGTVEFIVKDERAYFLEVNPRLQVEHPVTEMITGLDLIELQLRVVAGEKIPLSQTNVDASGHAIEARLYAEDPGQKFLPSAGMIEHLSLPNKGLRVDTGIAAGMAITPYYDPMVAKLISHGADRATAMAQMLNGLAQVSLAGVADNSGFLTALLSHPVIRQSAGDTGFIDRELDSLLADQKPALNLLAIAAAIWLSETCGLGWQLGWRLGDGSDGLSLAPNLQMLVEGEVHDIYFGPQDASGAILVGIGEERYRIGVERLGNSEFLARNMNETITVSFWQGDDWITLKTGDSEIKINTRPYLETDRLAGAAEVDGAVAAPLMGQVLAINNVIGDQVDKGDVLVILESMKMEIRVSAPAAGTITNIYCQVAGNVERGAIIVELDLAG